MKTILLILLLTLILCGSMQSFGQGINGSLNYQDFSKSELTLAELSLLTKIQLAGEFWFQDSKRWRELYDLEFIKNGQLNAKELVYIGEIGRLEVVAEENKPEWWQSPTVIIIISVISFGLGFGLAL